MLQRAIFLYGLFVVAIVSTGAAIWQSLETNLREEQLADASQSLVAARNEARDFKEKALLADRRIRVLEAAAATAPAPETPEAPSGDTAAAESEAKLRAELAAAKQQLAAAETAIRETEDRLADEIGQHAELKAKAQDLMDEVAAAGRAIGAVDAKTASQAPADAAATGSLPEPKTEAAANPVLEPAAPAKSPVKKVQKKPAKPIIRAVKPIGSPFEPIL